jgi:hypothetical protein
VLANVTFAWMLQCIAPYLTIDETAYNNTADDYQMWLAKVRWNCTYWHRGFWGKAGDYVPNIPVVNPAPGELDPPKRDPKAHEHSYTAKFWINGSEPRVPGHCQTEFRQPKKNPSDADTWLPELFSKYGDTNEYIHPVCAYRQMIRSDEQSALGAFKRKLDKNNGERGRYWWWHDDHALPEWVILQQDSPEHNFERDWYERCVKENKAEGDWLKFLDRQNNFDIREKKEPSFYPAQPQKKPE